ncbi:MAG: DUF429 domain-containing protein [Betaproteobacteria bacterium]|nr:DUF429 domain-containing protein [Betaproteobacteria bacterium]
MQALLGCDFSSSPSKQKAIVMAWGAWQDDRVVLNQLQRCESLLNFSQTLMVPGPWVGGFDLPFGLPRALVLKLGWPTNWLACMQHFASLSRDEIRGQFASFCNARQVGRKFAHRATDLPAGSSPSMKWVNPPVAFMMHAGVPLLLDAGVHLPGLQAGDTDRVALEAYPGLWSKRVLGTRSYKSDAPAKQTADRLIARKDLLHAMVWGHGQLPVRLKLSAAQQDALIEDATGDSMDAVLCMLQAAWADRQHHTGHPLYGLPPDMDPLEGWIVGA